MKRFTCMILVLLIGLSTSICFADDVTNNSFVKDAVQTMLTNASYNPSVYDMENVDFQNLKIGNKINYYKVVDFDEVSLQTNIHKYPIYDDEVVIGILTVIEENGEFGVVLSSEFCTELNNLNISSGALISQGENLYIVVEGKGILLTGDDLEERGMTNIDFKAVVENSFIPPENRGALQISKASPRAKQKHLLVPGVKQDFNGVC